MIGFSGLSLINRVLKFDVPENISTPFLLSVISRGLLAERIEPPEIKESIYGHREELTLRFATD